MEQENYKDILHEFGCLGYYQVDMFMSVPAVGNYISDSKYVVAYRVGSSVRIIRTFDNEFDARKFRDSSGQSSYLDRLKLFYDIFIICVDCKLSCV